jgi:uncharacterized membrane protein
MSTAPLETTQSSSRWQRWRKPILIASVALNVLFIGTVIGAAVRGGGPTSWSRGPGNVVGFIASLPKERREELMTRSKELRMQAKPLREQARLAARERSAALLAEPFDKQRFLDAQTKQIDAESKLRFLLRDIVAESAVGMSLAERRKFLNWREHRRGGGPPPDDADDPAPPAKK